MKHIYRYIYVFYVAIWVISQAKQLERIDYQGNGGNQNYEIINTLIFGNFLFGLIGLVFSLLILAIEKTNIYLIWTCAIGLAIAGGTLYLDATFTGNAAQAHMNSVLALFVWLAPVVICGWMGIVKDIGAAITKNRDDR